MNDKSQLRKNRVVVHLTDEEYKQFMEDLELLNLNTSDYIRWAIFRKRITFRCKRFEAKDELHKTINELKRIGVNVNQIAAKLNSEEQTEVPAEELKKLMSEIHLTNVKIVGLYSRLQDDIEEYEWEVQ